MKNSGKGEKTMCINHTGETSALKSSFVSKATIRKDHIPNGCNNFDRIHLARTSRPRRVPAWGEKRFLRTFAQFFFAQFFLQSPPGLNFIAELFSEENKIGPAICRLNWFSKKPSPDMRMRRCPSTHELRR